MIKKISQIITDVDSFIPKSTKEAEAFRIRYLGKNGVLSALFEDFKTVPSNKKKRSGSTS